MSYHRYCYKLNNKTIIYILFNTEIMFLTVNSNYIIMISENLYLKK